MFLVNKLLIVFLMFMVIFSKWSFLILGFIIPVYYSGMRGRYVFELYMWKTIKKDEYIIQVLILDYKKFLVRFFNKIKIKKLDLEEITEILKNDYVEDNKQGININLDDRESDMVQLLYIKHTQSYFVMLDDFMKYGNYDINYADLSVNYKNFFPIEAIYEEKQWEDIKLSDKRNVEIAIFLRKALESYIKNILQFYIYRDKTENAKIIFDTYFDYLQSKDVNYLTNMQKKFIEIKTLLDIFEEEIGTPSVVVPALEEKKRELKETFVQCVRHEKKKVSTSKKYKEIREQYLYQEIKNFTHDECILIRKFPET